MATNHRHGFETPTFGRICSDPHSLNARYTAVHTQLNNHSSEMVATHPNEEQGLSIRQPCAPKACDRHPKPHAISLGKESAGHSGGTKS